MADYVRLRLAAARLGVTMTLLGLIGGLADRAGAATGGAGAGLTKTLRTEFLKLEHKILGTVAQVDYKLTHSYYDKRAANATFLKIRTADLTYLKLDGARAEYLKIDAANQEFLKNVDANATFLKIEDANSRFLKIDGTAADAQKVGGITPDRLVQGRGNVLTGHASITDGTSQPQTLMGDGSVKILIGLMPNPQGVAGTPEVMLQNTDSSVALNFTFNGTVQTPTGQQPGGAGSIKPGDTVTLIPAVQTGGQLDVQIISAGGGGGAGKVWTLTVSTFTGGLTHTFVGQLLIGLL